MALAQAGLRAIQKQPPHPPLLRLFKRFAVHLGPGSESKMLSQRVAQAAVIFSSAQMKFERFK